jgi:hypothetical protein
MGCMPTIQVDGSPDAAQVSCLQQQASQCDVHYLAARPGRTPDQHDRQQHGQHAQAAHDQEGQRRRIGQAELRDDEPGTPQQDKKQWYRRQPWSSWDGSGNRR